MSAIDTVAHELCGQLAGLPVYRLLTQPQHDLFAFPISPADLMVGGGSGEHPEAAVDIVTAVRAFLLDDELYARDAVAGPRLHEFDARRLTQLLDLLDPLAKESDKAVRFAWRGDDWVRFDRQARALGGYGRGYDDNVDTSLESWIVSSLGEYALVALTDVLLDLLPDTLPDTLPDEIRALAVAVGDRPVYLNVLSFPAGYERLGGRRDTLGDGNVRH